MAEDWAEAVTGVSEAECPNRRGPDREGPLQTIVKEF